MKMKRSNIFSGMLWAAALLLPATAANAANGGLSFYLPGTFGSLAAAPLVPGWAYSTIYLHLHQSGGGSKSFTQGGNVVLGLDATGDALIQGISYTFATPILGAQATVAVLAAPGNVGVGIDARLTGPAGNSISGGTSDNRTSVSDVFYQGSLKWNQGVHNEMIYVSGNIPSGTYDSNRLANLSFGFTAVDFGAGYTYFDPKAGHEFSVVGGFTYSGMNNALQYQNGMDFHVDWAASQFLSKTMHVGLVGYYLQQITGDSGAGATLGEFKGRVFGLGPQVGFIIPLSEDYQAYLNLKAYKDIAAENRPEGYTAWLTFSVSSAPPIHAATAKPIYRK
jgi:hypothetical protein